MYQEMAQKSKIFVKQKLCIEREKNVFLMQIGGKSGKCIRRWLKKVRYLLNKNFALKENKII